MDILRNIILSGLGAAALTRDKVEQTLQKLVDEGRITADEARELADDLMREGENQWEDLRSRGNDLLRRGLDSADVASQKRLAELEAQVQRMETRLAMVEDRLAEESGGCED